MFLINKCLKLKVCLFIMIFTVCKISFLIFTIDRKGYNCIYITYCKQNQLLCLKQKEA